MNQHDRLAALTVDLEQARTAIARATEHLSELRIQARDQASNTTTTPTAAGRASLRTHHADIREDES
jgi:hypothetical protein